MTMPLVSTGVGYRSLTLVAMQLPVPPVFNHATALIHDISLNERGSVPTMNFASAIPFFLAVAVSGLLNDGRAVFTVEFAFTVPTAKAATVGNGDGARGTVFAVQDPSYLVIVFEEVDKDRSIAVTANHERPGVSGDAGEPLLLKTLGGA
jgi:hypothetical protein